MIYEFDLLRKHGWLADRSPKNQRLILACGRTRHFEKGMALYRYGDQSEGVFGIVSGNVSVTIPNDLGADHMIYVATPGFWIGDAALFSHTNRLVTVTAETDVDAVFLPKPKLLKLIQDHPKILEDFYALSHLNLAVALSLISNLVTPNAEKRLAAFFLNLDSRQIEPGAWIQLAQDRVASMVALSTPTVQRQMKALSDAGLVEIGYSRFRVAKPTELRRILTA